MSFPVGKWQPRLMADDGLDHWTRISVSVLEQLRRVIRTIRGKPSCLAFSSRLVTTAAGNVVDRLEMDWRI